MVTVGDKIVLFGGSGGGADFCDTWEWDGTGWIQKSATLTTGLHCIGHVMAALGGSVYLFGGVGARSDTWKYDGTSWTQVSTTGPGERSFASMATYKDKIVLFGGEQDANHILSDTWEWDGTTWTEKAVSGPSARWHSGMAAFGGKLVLFGGDGGSGVAWMGDTWEWDGASWTQPKVSGPSARYVYTLAAR
jgi:N-acetylneuraminic acid mutarotase